MAKAANIAMGLDLPTRISLKTASGYVPNVQAKAGFNVLTAQAGYLFPALVVFPRALLNVINAKEPRN